MKPNRTRVSFDRTVHRELMEALRSGGPLRDVIEFRNRHQDIIDVQLRRPALSRSRASVYAGLTRVIDLDCLVVGGTSRFRWWVEHATHQASPAAMEWRSWREWSSNEEAFSKWRSVRSYLDERLEWLTTPAANRHVREGKVHASMCSDRVVSYKVINREASPMFRSLTDRDSICAPIRAEIRRALASSPAAPPWLHDTPFGTSPDIVALAADTLLVIEAKPIPSAGIVTGPMQARFYGGMVASWLVEDDSASDALGMMLAQRVDLGLTKGPKVSIEPRIAVTPVLAIGPGPLSADAEAHAVVFRDALNGANPTLAGRTRPTEIWQLDERGNVARRF